MKVISIKGNKVNFDMTQEEYDIFLRYGLQLWIDKKVGKNKFKVLPPDLQLIPDKDVKPMTKKEIKEEDKFCNELLTLAVVDALRAGMKKDKSSILCNCKCEDDCKCEEHTCKK